MGLQFDTTLAMAGPAEAAEFFGLLVGWGALCLVGFLAYIAIAARSRVLAWVNAVLHLAITVLFNPLWIFATLSPGEAGDPDVQAWMSNWRVFFVGWLVVTIGVVAAMVLGFIRKPPEPEPPPYCLNCGYDVRAFAGRCPKCVTPPPATGTT